jgi:integrase/recombinase XerD
MMARPFFRSSLGPVIARYLELKEALGRSYANERAVLRHLDAFLVDDHAGDLAHESFARWCFTLHHLRSGVRRNRMRVVRNLCLYRRRTEPSCFVPDEALFPTPHQYVKPYIFTEAEIARLLSVTRQLLVRPSYPLRQQAFRLALVLLYTTGLRRGELLRMSLADYDRNAQTLLVRASKFHKSRYLPLASDACQEVERYLRARRAHEGAGSPDAPLLWNGSSTGRSYTGVGFGRVFRMLLRMAAIHKPNGLLPRVHDVRHSFAVNALLRWYRSGTDVQAKLPLLATYMGHVSIASTLHYLSFIEPLATCASARFAECYGAAITSLPRGAR